MHEKAIEQYETGLTISPDYTLIHYNKALAHFSLKEYTEAFKHYNRAVELGYPENPRFRNAIEDIL